MSIQINKFIYNMKCLFVVSFRMAIVTLIKPALIVNTFLKNGFKAILETV